MGKLLSLHRLEKERQFMYVSSCRNVRHITTTSKKQTNSLHGPYGDSSKSFYTKCVFSHPVTLVIITVWLKAGNIDDIK